MCVSVSAGILLCWGLKASILCNKWNCVCVCVLTSIPPAWCTTCYSLGTQCAHTLAMKAITKCWMHTSDCINIRTLHHLWREQWNTHTNTRKHTQSLIFTQTLPQALSRTHPPPLVLRDVCLLLLLFFQCAQALTRRLSHTLCDNCSNWSPSLSRPTFRSLRILCTVSVRPLHVGTCLQS